MLQQPNGLFYHAPDVPFFWGRGNGWTAAGMAELLRSLPADHPNRPRILESYRKMLATLLEYQGENGMWRQLIDRPEAWPETSCTGMFTFAMITGVKQGWLQGSQYTRAARNGWARPDQLPQLRRRRPGGLRGHEQTKPTTVTTSSANATWATLHGQAPILWSASALLR